MVTIYEKHIGHLISACIRDSENIVYSLQLLFVYFVWRKKTHSTIYLQITLYYQYNSLFFDKTYII